MMTLEQFIDHERNRLNKILGDQKPLFLAAQSALSLLSERVFTNGQSTTGATFQYNSTTPLYVNPLTTFGNTSGLKPPKGKTGKTKFASGKNHKTTYVSSYQELRQKVGREAGFVNFEAHGDLKSEIENRSSGQVTPKKVSDTEYVIEATGRNGAKLNGLNDRFPNVFKLAPSEQKTFFGTYNFEMLKLLNA